MNLRQQQQQAFDRSGEPLIVGNVSYCPLPPETLAALGPDSLCGAGIRLRPDRRGLSSAHRRQGVQFKETSRRRRRCQPQRPAVVLNEVQRRQALQQLKDDPVTAPRFTHIVPTLYADYRLGILLSPDRRRADTPVDPAADRPAIYYSGSLRRTGADGVGSL